MAVEHDEIGIWSEVKLAIIKKYASAYTTIMEAQRRDKIHACVGSTSMVMPDLGHHVSKTQRRLG